MSIEKIWVLFLIFAVLSLFYINEREEEYQKTPKAEFIKNMKSLTTKMYAGNLALDDSISHKFKNQTFSLSSDYTGKRFDLFFKKVRIMETQWKALSSFGGYRGISELKGWIKEFKELGIPINVKAFYPNAYAIANMMNMDKNMFPKYNNCKKNNWVHRGLLSDVAAYGCIECVKLLIEKYNSDPSWSDCFGATPAMRAAFNGHFDIVKYLVPLMTEEARNSQMNYDYREAGLYDLVSKYDFDGSNGVDPRDSAIRIKSFLYEYGIKSTPEMIAEKACFSFDINNKYKDNFITQQSFEYSLSNVVLEDYVLYCPYLYSQYEYRCNTTGVDCDKQKQMFVIINSLGFDMSSWNKIKHLFPPVVPSIGRSWLRKDGNILYRNIMRQENGYKCNIDFSNCNQELVWKRLGFGVVYRGN